MSKEEVKKAIEGLESIKKMCLAVQGSYFRDDELVCLNRAISFLETYLALEERGMKKKEYIDKYYEIYGGRDFDNGYNQALSDYNLFLAGRLDVEKLAKVYYETTYPTMKYEHLQPQEKRVFMEYAQALHTYLIRKEG